MTNGLPLEQRAAEEVTTMTGRTPDGRIGVFADRWAALAQAFSGARLVERHITCEVRRLCGLKGYASRIFGERQPFRPLLNPALNRERCR